MATSNLFIFHHKCRSWYYQKLILKWNDCNAKLKCLLLPRIKKNCIKILTNACAGNTQSYNKRYLRL